MQKYYTSIMDCTNYIDHNDYMALIYKHPNIDMTNISNYRSLIATTDIKIGELILLEHVYAAKSHICQLVVENNTRLFDMYHPRLRKYSETEAQDRKTESNDKLSHNCFGMDNGSKIINIYLQQINHSCTANCCVFIQLDYKLAETDIVFMELYAIKNIPKDTELTINYGPRSSHGRDFECLCGLELNVREKIYSIGCGIANTLSKENKNTIKKMIYDYLQEPVSKKVLLNQYLATNGIFMNDDKISGYTLEGRQMINHLVKRYLGIGNDIKLPDGAVIEDRMNQYKMDLFLEIIRKTLLAKESPEKIE